MQARHRHAVNGMLAVLVWSAMIIGCSGRPASPTQPPAATPTPVQVATETALPPATATEEIKTGATVAPLPLSTPTPVSAEEGLLFADDFTALESGWPAQEFDNFYIGYHEPEWYHVEIQTPNDDAVVALPGLVFDDFTLETEVLIEPNLTATEGDFRYGLIFRRSGNQWYGFVISPRTGSWAVLKRSPNALEVLMEGQTDLFQPPGSPDALRVDAKGSAFFFQLNGQDLGTITDSDFASGEIGFYVQNGDSAQVHVHYDSLRVREVEAPTVECRVVTTAVNLRRGPGVSFPVVAVLGQDETFTLTGRNQDGSWLRAGSESMGELGWVANMPTLVSCTVPVLGLPIVEP